MLLRRGRAKARSASSRQMSRPSTSYQSFRKDVDARHPATPRLRRTWCQSAEASAKAGTRPGMTRFNTALLAKAPHAPAEKIRPQHQRDLPCPSPSQKIFRFRRRANQFYQLGPSFPGKRGASRSSRTRDGMRWTRQRWRAVRRAVSVSEQQRADERRFNASAKTRRAAHGSSRALVEVAAYGEVVWSWHPLLMPSLAEIKSAQPGVD
jgi:hypothetical protein